MSVWAYGCRPCSGEGEPCFVARDAVGAMPARTRVLRVKVGPDWICAVVDRHRPVAVEGMLVRDAVAAQAGDCAECARLLDGDAGDVRAGEGAADAVLAGQVGVEEISSGDGAAGRQVQAAAVALQGVRMLVVLVGLEVVQAPGEADMLLADLRSRLGGHDIVLMGQRDDGTPVYHGDPVLTALLADVPIERMPWKAYAIG